MILKNIFTILSISRVFEVSVVIFVPRILFGAEMIASVQVQGETCNFLIISRQEAEEVFGASRQFFTQWILKTEKKFQETLISRGNGEKYFV